MLPQGADVAILEDPRGSDGDLDHLFAVGRHGGTRVANMGEMDDPEIYLQIGPPRAGSHTGTFGEPDCSMPTEEVSFVGIFFDGT